MMNRLYFILCTLAFAYFIIGCKKKEDEWKLPTDVTFQMDIKKESSTQPNLAFTGGTIVLSSFTFEGERIQGEDIYFSESFPSGLTIPFSPDNTIEELSFDIPQGTYTLIDISFETYDEEDDNSITIDGVYSNTNGEEIPLKFEYKAGETFSIVAEDEEGGNEIMLSTDVPSLSTIELDPVHWFQVVTMTSLEDANRTTIDGVPTIIISSDSNEDIYDLIVDRIDESAEVVFK